MTTNIKLISEKLRNNTLMSTLTISIEHSTGSLSHSNQGKGEGGKHSLSSVGLSSQHQIHRGS